MRSQSWHGTGRIEILSNDLMAQKHQGIIHNFKTEHIIYKHNPNPNPNKNTCKMESTDIDSDMNIHTKGKRSIRGSPSTSCSNNKHVNSNQEQKRPKRFSHKKKNPKKNKKNNHHHHHHNSNENQHHQETMSLEEQGRYVALDCEFVGVGPGGYKSALARVSLVDYENTVLIDAYVKVSEPITDYRTFVSGITEEHHLSSPDPDSDSDSNLDSNSSSSDTQLYPLAMDFDKCIQLVKKMLDKKILVGHGLKNDLHVLGIDHPWYDIRDTAKYEPFMKKTKKIKNKNNDVDVNARAQMPLPQTLRPRKLKDLAWTKLGREIQKDGEPHCSVEDAIAALDLYKKARTKWELAMTYKIDRTRQIEFFQMMISSSTEQ